MSQNDLLAKLLASENIDIIRGSVKTASFDIVNRVLTLPQWQDMTNTIELMLKAHEVGHALYSHIELLTDECKAPKSYINVIEDVRIERKIKVAFPGLRKDFTQGYKELNDRDFFGVANTDLSDLNLINRINLYFKAGFSCGVKFDAEEQSFVERAKSVDSIADVITLSEDIYKFSKDKLKDDKEKLKVLMEDDGNSEEYESEEDAISVMRQLGFKKSEIASIFNGDKVPTVAGIDRLAQMFTITSTDEDAYLELQMYGLADRNLLAEEEDSELETNDDLIAALEDLYNQEDEELDRKSVV